MASLECFFFILFATKCDTAIGYIKRLKQCLRYSGADGDVSIQIIDRWCFVVGDISLCRRCISDSVRFNLQCSAAESNKPLPETNRACHIWLSVRLLLFHMCSGASFRASQIIIRKDEGLWEEPLGCESNLPIPSILLPPPPSSDFNLSVSSLPLPSYFANASLPVCLPFPTFPRLGDAVVWTKKKRKKGNPIMAKQSDWFLTYEEA